MDALKGKSDSEIAALAVRCHSDEILISGLDSLFASSAVHDYRDIISALVLYYDAAKRLGLNPDSFFLQYGETNGLSRKHLAEFVSRKPELKGIEVGGYKVVDRPEFGYVFKFSEDSQRDK